MEFICNKDDLGKGVQTVERIVSTRSTLPIIGNILFEAKKSGLKISANNLEMGIEILVSAKVSKEGSVLIPAKTLGGVVSKLPEGDVSFKLKDKGLINISYKRSVFNIHSLPPDEFPQLPKIKEVKSIAMDSGVLVGMIEQTIFATSNSEDKYVLNGILLEVGKTAHESSNFRLIATDGYRLAKCGRKIDGAEGTAKVIVPAKTMGEVLKVLGKKGQVRISLSNDQIAFKYEKMYLVSRLIQGQFPDYRQVMPKGAGMKVTVDTEALLRASERAAVIASQSANIIKTEVRGDQLHIMAQAPDVGSVDEVLDVEVTGKGKSSIAFNVRLLTDALKVIEDEKVLIELGESLSPGLIRPKGEEDFVYIVMPIRTQEVVA